MSKKNNIYEQISKKVGGELLIDSGRVKGWIDTGNLSLNYLCSGKFVGGGIPQSRVIEIFGPSSSCKSLWANNMLHGVQKMGGWAVVEDAENSLNADFAQKASHIDINKLIVLYPTDLQEGFDNIHRIAHEIRAVDKEKPIVIVYDSIAASPSPKEVQEVVSVIDDKDKAKEVPAEHAKICSREFRKLTPLLEKENVSLILINQIRANIGVLYGAKDKAATGGFSLEFYASLRLRTKAEKKFKDSKGNVIGMGVTVRNVKNKCFRPFVEAQDMQLFYDKGINPFGGLLGLLSQLGRIEPAGKGMYKVSEPWAGGKDLKFKASKERNDVPAEMLLECPAVVDAVESSQIQEYINVFGDALSAVSNDISKEEVVSEVED